MNPPHLSSHAPSYVVPMTEADCPLPGRLAPVRSAGPHAAPQPEQAAAVPYRVRDGHTEVLLVTSRTRGRWIVPKGHIERGASPVETAAAEAFEESGVRGAVRSEPLGRYRHGRGHRAPLVEAYLLCVEAEEEAWPERAERQRRWVAASSAASHVGVAGLRPVLRLAAAALAALDPSP